MTKYFISSVESNGYAVGSDTNDGLTKQTPWLTADHAFASGLTDGNELVFNDGTYEVNKDGASAVAVHVNALQEFKIDFENDFKTVLHFNGTAETGIAWTASETVSSNYHIGRCFLTFSGATWIKPMDLIQASNAQYVNFMSGARMVPLAEISRHSFLWHNLKHGKIELFDSGWSNTDGSMVDLDTTEIGELAKPKYGDTGLGPVQDLIIRKCQLNVRAACQDVWGVIGWRMKAGGEYPTEGRTDISGVTGKFIVTGTNSLKLVYVRDRPSARVTRNSNLVLKAENPDTFITPFAISAPDATCIAPVIGWNKNVYIFGNNGFATVMGLENKDGKMPNNLTICNHITVFSPDPDAIFHGLTNTHTLECNGIRTGNVVIGAAIGGLTKKSNAVSYGNFYGDVNQSGLYIKYGLKGACFRDETVALYEQDQILDVQSSKDGNGGEQGQGEFYNNRIIAPQGASIHANGYVSVYGSGSDDSFGTERDLVFSPNISVTAPFAYYQGTPFNTLEDWQASVHGPVVRVPAAQKIVLHVLGAAGRTDLTYTVKDREGNFLFTGNNLVFDSQGRAELNVECFDLEDGETLYYELSNFDIDTVTPHQVGFGKALVQAA